MPARIRSWFQIRRRRAGSTTTCRRRIQSARIVERNPGAPCWQLHHASGDYGLWTRRGKSKGDGPSTSTNYAGRGLLYVFSSNAYSFASGTSYTKFFAWCLLEHHGNYFRGGARTVEVRVMKNFSEQLTEELKTLALLSESEYRTRSAQVASKLGCSLEHLDLLWKPARDGHLKTLGAQSPEAFFGFESLKEVRDRITSFEGQVRDDLGFVYSKDYIEAAAALGHFDTGGLTRLGNVLKSKGLSSRDRWETTVRQSARQERDRVNLQGAARQGQSGHGKGRSSQATTLVDLAQAHAKFFHDGENTYASVEVSGHTENHDLKSRAFKRWLAQLNLAQTQKAPNAEAMGSAINTLSGIAQFQCPERKVFVRVAGHGGNIYLDLCDADWRVVEVTAAGWKVIASKGSPVVFRRAPGMQPLPVPIKGGAIKKLRELVNIRDDDQFMCYVATLIAAFRDCGPYPVLLIQGEQGSAKSTAQRYWRALIDPNHAPLRRPPREPRDLAIAANNSWVVSLNNLSYIPDWLSDDLSCLCTGQGFAVRALYTDRDETIFSLQRPIAINGIEDMVRRGDLADRLLSVRLPSIPPGKYLTEKKLDMKFAQEAPGILGCLLDAVATALRNLPTTEIENLPRMADFLTWWRLPPRPLAGPLERFRRFIKSTSRPSARPCLRPRLLKRPRNSRFPGRGLPASCLVSWRNL
jgi:hypothetical protein